MPVRAPRSTCVRHAILVAVVLVNLAIWLRWADPVATWRAVTGADRAPKQDCSLVGQPCPDLQVAVCRSCSVVPSVTPTGGDERINLSAFRGKQVLCLFLGSVTCPFWHDSVPAMDSLYHAYEHDPRVAVYFLYVQEHQRLPDSATPEPGQVMTARASTATACATQLKLDLPLLLDGADNAANEAFHVSVGSATIVVDIDGTVVFHTWGQFGMQPAAARRVLTDLLAPHG